jgi:ketoreductase
MLVDRVALVTGASRGIGRAIAIGLAREGAAVGVVARSAGDLDSCAAEIRASGGTAIAVRADVTSAADIRESVARVAGELGPVDILVNNAGDNILGRFLEQDEESWWEQIELGIRAPYRYCRALLASMIERKRGRIINILSVNAKKAGPFMTAYATAKHAVLGMTRALAAEVARTGVTVNAICPGWVLTDLTRRTMQQRSELFGVPVEKVEELALATIPQRVVMDPDDIVPLTVFLASDGSQRITGEALNICGGMIMH